MKRKRQLKAEERKSMASSSSSPAPPVSSPLSSLLQVSQPLIRLLDARPVALHALLLVPLLAELQESLCVSLAVWVPNPGGEDKRVSPARPLLLPAHLQVKAPHHQLQRVFCDLANLLYMLAEVAEISILQAKVSVPGR